MGKDLVMDVDETFYLGGNRYRKIKMNGENFFHANKLYEPLFCEVFKHDRVFFIKTLGQVMLYKCCHL
jgi:hypothetical protein